MNYFILKSEIVNFFISLILYTGTIVRFWIVESGGLLVFVELFDWGLVLVAVVFCAVLVVLLHKIVRKLLFRLGQVGSFLDRLTLYFFL